MNTIKIEGNLQGYYLPIIGDDKDKEVFMLVIVDSRYVAVSLKLGFRKLKFIGRDLKITLEGQKK